VTPPNETGTSTSPAPVFSLLRGFEPSAFTPSERPASAATSRTAPLTITPAQPFPTASAPIWSPISAQASEPPPSATSTRPAAGSESCARSSALSSWQRTVLIAPSKARTPPNWRSCSSQETSSLPCSSQRSAVAGTVTGAP
jgi:hypothetical protein